MSLNILYQMLSMRTKTIDRKISQNIQRIFDRQSSQLERLCENNIISRDILDEYEQAIRESNIQKAATVNESVTKIIDNLCIFVHGDTGSDYWMKFQNTAKIPSVTSMP